MITLFRRIRQKLIDSGSITKYLLYALGEILLVVIGILIALQVNNWNEERKTLQSVNNTLREVQRNLEQDLESLEIVSGNNDRIMADLQRLTVAPDVIPNDSLDIFINRLHRASAFDPITFGYEKLLDLEMPNEVPDSLTRQLAQYYREYDGGLNNIAYDELSIFNINKYRDYMIKKGFPVMEHEQLPDRAPEFLREIVGDTEFQGIVRSNYYSRNVQILGFNEAKSAAKSSLLQIESFLNQPR